MKEVIINETPVRTAKNFSINNIKLNDIEIPENIPEFENVTIICDTEKVDINQDTSNINLSYGLDDFFTNQIKTKANQKIKLEAKSEICEGAEISFNFDEDNFILLDDIEFIAKENSKSSLIIRYNSEEEINAFHNGILRINAKQNSEVNIIFVNFLNTKSSNFIAIENNIEENAKLNFTIIDFGGKNSITNYYSNLVGDNSNNNLNTIYLGKESQVFDLNYIGELRGKKSNINIEVQGALKDKAKKHFKGTIDFKKGCKKATGNENETCMLLSDTAKSIALPMLLCSEEDVEGNHSTSAGKVRRKRIILYYE